jgi:hypothetical protein
MHKLTVGLLLLASSASTAAAQEGASPWIVRPWFSFDLGAGMQTRVCPDCARTNRPPQNPDNAWGPAWLLATGLTLTRAFAVGAALRTWSFIDGSFAGRDRSGVYYLAVAQYMPPRATGLVVSGSVGKSELDEGAFGGGEAGGVAVGFGLAVRVPARSSIAARLSADYQHTLNGRYTEFAHLQPAAGAYRARLLTLAVGVSGLFLPRRE